MKYDDLCNKLISVINDKHRENTKKEKDIKRIVNLLKEMPEAYTNTSEGTFLTIPESISKKSIIHEAIGCPILVKILLDAGVNPNSTNEENFSPLISATGAGPCEIVDLLLAAGANPNWPDISGRSALYYAVTNMCFEKIRSLIEAGAKPNESVARDDEDLIDFVMFRYRTYLSKESWLKLDEMLRLLVEVGNANLELSNVSQDKPLYKAIELAAMRTNSIDEENLYLRLGTVRNLLSYGAVIHDPDKLFKLLKGWHDQYDPTLVYCLDKLYQHLKTTAALPELLQNVEEYFKEVQHQISVSRSLTQDALNNVGFRGAVAELIADYEILSLENEISKRKTSIQVSLINLGVTKVVAELIADFETPSFSGAVFFKPTEMPIAVQPVLPSINAKVIDKQEEAKLQIKCASACSMM